MPNPINRRTGQQWRLCDRCGRLFPLSELTTQQGLVVCSRDFDNSARFDSVRQEIIANILNIGNDTEGADTRDVDLAFFNSDVGLER